MIKTAQQQAQYNAFYNLGVRAALGHTKTAANLKYLAVNPVSLRKMLSGGVDDSLLMGVVRGERTGGQLGSVAGALSGGAIGEGLARASDIHSLELLAGLAGAVGGGSLGNIVGRHLGAGVGGMTGAISGLEPFRGIGNLLADPLRRVPGIRG